MMDPIAKDAIKMAELSLDEGAKSLVKDVLVTIKMFWSQHIRCVSQ